MPTVQIKASPTGMLVPLKVNGVNVGSTPLTLTDVVGQCTLEVPFLITPVQAATPSTVIQTGYGDGWYPPIQTAHQRKSFYAKGRHWRFFWSNDAVGRKGMFYSTSTDGINWTPQTYYCWGFFFEPIPDFFSLHFDGTYLHTTNSPSGADPWYEKSVPNADGTLTSIAEKQAIPELQGHYIDDGTISVDSEGYPIIGTYYGMDELNQVSLCSKNDGTWPSCASGFPYFLNNKRPHRGVGVMGLTNRKFYALYYRAYHESAGNYLPEPIYGKLWNGVQFGPEEQASMSSVMEAWWHQISFVANNDDVHVIFHKYETNELVYLIRDSIQGWLPEIVIAQVMDRRVCPVVCWSHTLNRPVFFWCENNSVYCCIYPESPVEWIKEVPLNSYTGIGLPQEIICDEHEWDGLIGVSWLLTHDPSTIFPHVNMSDTMLLRTAILKT